MNLKNAPVGALLAPVLFSLSLAPAGAAGAPDARVAQLLRTSGAAINAQALGKIKVFEIDAKVSGAGLSGTGTAWQEAGGDRFAETYSTPPIAGGDGFDGKNVWNADGSGLVWSDGGIADRAQEIAQAYIANCALWSPHQRGATVTWDGTKAVKDASYDVLSVRPRDAAVPFEMWFDRVSHLLVRATQTIGPVTSVTTFSNYKRFAGVMFAYASHADSGDGNTTDATVTRIVVNPPGGAAHLRRPSTSAHDYGMTGGKTQTVIPIELVENHVYLSVMLNGKGPYRFIYDTGGENVVDTDVAKEIGETATGSAAGNGAGSATEAISFATARTLQVGDAMLRDQLFSVAPVRQGFGVSAGQRVDGLIGFEVLSRFITTFDYANNRVILSMSAAPGPAGADIVPFVLNGKQPEFDCTVDAIASRCAVDTGARDSITLQGPFISDHPQVVPRKLAEIGVGGFGFGGAAYGRLGRLQTLGFGRFVLRDVVADFTAQQKGAFARPFVAGNIGGGIWKRFTLTLDYDKLTMTLVPNAALNTPDSYERAGLFLINQGGKYVIFDARPGTPAAKAGLIKGDTIDSVDGQPASSMSLGAVRDTFMRPAGTVVKLGITGKDGTSREVVLTLEDIV
jgi:hypothetical protein